MTTKQKPVCRTCGSDHISADAACRYNVDTQQWELSGDVYDKSEYCDECEGETRARWVDVDAADLTEASAGFKCQACGREESQCSASPCEAVERDREDDEIGCRTCSEATETRALPCDECGQSDDADEDEETCPIHRQPVSRCPASCDHGEARP